MPIWLILAVLLTVGVTALLVAVLYRINLPAAGKAQDRERDGQPPM